MVHRFAAQDANPAGRRAHRIHLGVHIRPYHLRESASCSDYNVLIPVLLLHPYEGIEVELGTLRPGSKVHAEST